MRARKRWGRAAATLDDCSSAWRRKAGDAGYGEGRRAGLLEADGAAFDRKSEVAGRKRFGRDSVYGVRRC